MHRQAPRSAIRALAVAVTLAAVATAAAPGWVLVRVRPGDTLSAIAARTGTSVRALVALNGLPGNGDLIFAGQQLKVGKAAPAATAPTAYVRHRVVLGDTLYGLAARYHADWRRIAAVNHLPASLVIQRGTTLLIPSAAHAAPTTRSTPRPAAGHPVSHAQRVAVRDLIARTARAHGVDAALALAVSYQESGFNPTMVSASGAIGAMQVMPATGRYVSRYLVGRTLDLRDPADNALAGVALLESLLRVTDARTAVAAYYQGLASVRSRGMYGETRSYVANVLALRSGFTARGYEDPRRARCPDRHAPRPTLPVMDTTLTDPLVGRVLDGRYAVGTRLARGGMASVYLATDTRLDRTVAVKVMHPALADDEEFVARFIREAKAAAALSHPNAVAVFDQGADGETVYLVMEYVAGRTLRDVLRENRRLSPGQALTLLEPVLEALSAAHRAGLVHRDVKPENVLIADDGRVKVADFGLARAVSASTLTASQTVLIGTVAYLAPELVTRGVADARADVYAAGVMLYELVTGEPPFTGETPLAVAYRHVHEDVPAPSERAPSVPPEVDALVRSATASDPADRPADAAALLPDVRRVRDLVGGPVPVPVSTDPHSETQVVVRPSDTTVVRTPPPPPAQRTKRSGRRRWPWVAAGLALVTLLAAVGGWWLAAGRYTDAPKLVGMRLAAARSAATHDGFQVKVATGRFDDTVPAGSVAVQQPGPGKRLERGGTLTLVPSKGPEMHDVPNVVNAQVAPAKAEIEKAHLHPVVDPAVYDESVPAGHIISTDPPPGTSVRHDTDVHLFPSKGPPPVPVPNVVGKKLDDAKQALTQAGLTWSIVETYSDKVKKGEVMAQDPADGELPKGSAVTLTVSKGPHLYQVPDVTGMQVDQAKKVLEHAGFKVSVHSIPGPGIVRSQNPDGGSMQRKGTTVSLYVW